ncbi:hypothetical protein FK85_26650 [Halorubrum saccharovorum]|uniref:Uncharacterized protein n=1 Tax=Halorubrum saccharovorum TaxID=2248 RepID=A0A0F8CLB4_9EURY|nr:hypothetical protein [Halorubrum saccharovorum]KKF39667.1 hypothetical protein FK85_26650 [Halorubrum saccharovorum]
MSLIGSAVTFAVSLLVGGLAIFIAAAVVTGTRDYGHAVFTALVGAVVWGLTAFFLSWVPLVGEFFPLLAWIWVIRARYGTSWVHAGIIGFVAWASAVLVLAVLPFAGVDAVGVPFVRSLGAI